MLELNNNNIRLMLCANNFNVRFKQCKEISMLGVNNVNVKCIRFLLGANNFNVRCKLCLCYIGYKQF